jgi:hypothetical protein
MTDEMMTLRTLLEKSSDADLLREMIGFTAQRLPMGRRPRSYRASVGSAGRGKQDDCIVQAILSLCSPNRGHDRAPSNSKCRKMGADGVGDVGGREVSVVLLGHASISMA